MLWREALNGHWKQVKDAAVLTKDCCSAAQTGGRHQHAPTAAAATASGTSPTPAPIAGVMEGGERSHLHCF